MPAITVRDNMRDVLAGMRSMTQDVTQRATVLALNRSIDRAYTEAAREARGVGYNVRIGDIKALLRRNRASAASQIATLTASGKPIPLIKYGARQTSRGVTVQVLNGRKLIPGAFIATMPSGHTGVYVRDPHAKHKKVKRAGHTSWHALPIRELFGPSVPDMFVNYQVSQSIMDLIDAEFTKRFEHELTRLSK
jgi:hypothetical protein